MKIRFLFLVFVFSFSIESIGQIVISPATPAQMVANLTGPGITYSNVTFTGDPNVSAAIYSNGNTTNLGLASGVVLTTGSANLIPVNNSGSEGLNNSGGALPELNTIAGATTYDGVVLEFDFVPLSNQINVNYIFGSEEYLEFVNAGFNDAFAFFISGPGIVGQQNIATVAGVPVTIDNINNTSNAAFFVNNTGSFGANSIEYDGFTTVLTAARTVIPCSTYHIKLMIADGGDGVWDSGVFIAENGLFAPGAGSQLVSVQPAYNFPNAVEGCTGSQFVFSIPAALPTATTINFTVGGTATSGADYVPLPNSVTIPAGQTSVTLPVNVLSDALTEGSETIVITLQATTCSNQPFTLTIVDPTPISVSATGTAICQGAGPVTITSNATGGNGTVNYSWNNGAGNGSSVSVNPATTTTYTVTATDQCGKTATATATVTVSPPPISSFTVSSPVCEGSASTITYTGNAGAGANFNWNFVGGTAVPGGNVPGPHTVTWSGSGNFPVSLTVSLGTCTSTVSTQNVLVNPSPAAPQISSNSPFCEGQTLNLTSNTVPGATYVWSGPGGFISALEDPSVANSTLLNSGTYSLYVVVSGCTSATSNVNVLINATPPAPVIASNSPICIGDDLSLTSDTYAGVQYVWSGPSGFTSAIEDPTILNAGLPNSGNYSLYLVLNGCTSTVSSLSAVVSPIPTSDFALTPSVCAGSEAFALYGGNAPAGAAYAWSFSGTPSVTGSGQGPVSFLWPSAGSQTVSLTVSIGSCVSVQTTQPVNIIPTLTPDAGPDQTLCSGATIQVGDAAQQGVPGYTWLTANGIANPSSGFSPASWVNNGNSVQILTLVLEADTQGCVLRDTTLISVVPNPVFAIQQPGAQCLSGNSFTFSANGNILSNANYNWTFQNAQPGQSALANPAGIEFSVPGTQQVILTVDQFGCTGADTISILVNPSPQADFAYAPGQGCMPLSVNFTDQSISPSGAALSYAWVFGNGTSSSQASPSVVYADEGVYSVSLTVTDPIGCSSESTQNNIIQVYPPPVAGFSATPMTVYIDQPIVNVYDGSLGNVNQWSYSVSNGMQFNSPNFSINFSDVGAYTITQTVSDGFGCSASAVLEINVMPISTLFVPNSFTPGNNDGINSVFRPVGTNLTDYRLAIFNRWGELIFTSGNVEEGWDGMVRGSQKPAKGDVYVYKVDYTDHKGYPQLVLGHVSLIR
jgi:gliding motility-associated-like protein